MYRLAQGCTAEGFADPQCLVVGCAQRQILAEADLDWEESGHRYTTWNYSAVDYEEMW